ncbi:alpha-amylase family glycosyl hydrolase [Aliifodinibius sp. S!AR15-10]|uniref:alpha-amylase family glycosyl hydrolase n=1 Tax=Aliifodinibius sp. S!AR15-10 TaxID=2950437 RepID=UPI002862FC39|nr:alpha-amylase family glycosyl hydrolase [Aliifodinibius sp. S!AR15-10]MDR8392390.1 alpha-amylase family glycosyl hydrolase [Aliifodinibius sp. S!AR15-10]
MKSKHDIDLKELTRNREYYPSPEEWEEQILYFLITDRFSTGEEKNLYNPERDYENALRDENTKKRWLKYGTKWNGGTLKGIKSKIDYLAELGVTAIWISPIFKQVSFEETYHGYGIQNFLDVDPHFGTKAELKQLAEEVHSHNMYFILDIILNHAGNVFQYENGTPNYDGNVFPIKAFLDENGKPAIRPDPVEVDTLYEAWPDGGIWPIELMSPDAFTRKGQIVDWDRYPEYTEGDFLALKNIYTGNGEFDEFHPSEALKILTECYKYWIAYADIDGFRLDTVKHLEPGATRYFVREIHEFTKTIGKNNFYVIGEITGGFEFAIETLDKTGVDAALGINQIPEKLENVAKGYLNPVDFFDLFKNSELLGEDEYRWYKDNVVVMFDDHDMVAQTGHSRFCADKKTAPLLLNALFLNLMSPGIPCIYYGTEQGFDGSGDHDKYVRETMFEGKFGAFRTVNRHFFNVHNPIFRELSKMIKIRKENLTLRQGRVYQRAVSYKGVEFELPHKLDETRHTGVIVWSRIFSTEEIVLACNCDLENDRNIYVVIDSGLHMPGSVFECIYSTESSQESHEVEVEELVGKNVIRFRVPRSGSVAYRNKPKL